MSDSRPRVLYTDHGFPDVETERALVEAAGGELVVAQTGATLDTLHMSDFDMPIYSIDREKVDGVPSPAQRFLDAISVADGLVISFAEHNGSFTAAFKNVFDWASRIEGKVYQSKPLLALSTAPGPRGGQSVLEHAVAQAPFRGAANVVSFSLPKFGENFTEDGLAGDHGDGLAKAIGTFIATLS